MTWSPSATSKPDLHNHNSSSSVQFTIESIWPFQKIQTFSQSYTYLCRTCVYSSNLNFASSVSNPRSMKRKPAQYCWRLFRGFCSAHLSPLSLLNIHQNFTTMSTFHSFNKADCELYDWSQTIFVEWRKQHFCIVEGKEMRTERKVNGCRVDCVDVVCSLPFYLLIWIWSDYCTE